MSKIISSEDFDRKLGATQTFLHRSLVTDPTLWSMWTYRGARRTGQPYYIQRVDQVGKFRDWDEEAWEWPGSGEAVIVPDELVDGILMELVYAKGLLGWNALAAKYWERLTA